MPCKGDITRILYPDTTAYSFSLSYTQPRVLEVYTKSILHVSWFINVAKIDVVGLQEESPTYDFAHFKLRWPTLSLSNYTWKCT